MKKFTLFAFFLLPFLFSCTYEKYKTVTQTDDNGFVFETVTDDPLGTRIYTLENGLKVFLSVNTDEPRIATLVGVRAGSAHDPIETTGLAHYFEHLMFKGTNQIGTINWEEEEPLLQEISGLFEKYRDCVTSEEKRAVYGNIDSLSQIAARYVATNEYDKMISSMGAKHTNAGTSYDFTVYVNDIPKNEMEKWMMLESERFGDIVLRLFHTELETVYEEYNTYQDIDGRRANMVLMEALFPEHPYGRQVIGLAAHLKNPSMEKIYEFAHTFYVPNNMAVALSGDLDFDETILMVDKYFGELQRKEVPKVNNPVEKPLQGPIVKDVYGPDIENLLLAFRFDGDNSEDRKYVAMIDMMLSNQQAGLIDLNLVQQQKVLQAGSYTNFLKDYGIHMFYGTPRENQTLEEVKDLLLAELEKVKKGEFDNWMLDAITNAFRLSEIQQQESNFSRVFTYVDAFTKDISYLDRLKFIDELETVSKADLVKFANEKYTNNWAVVYKRFGENMTFKKVEKPEITKVPINREYQSDFYKEFSSIETDPIKPVFVDFKSEIRKMEILPGIDMFHIKNDANEIFRLYYIINMGKNHNKLFPLAVEYLPYIGTDQYSPAELQKEFFRLGLTFGVSSGNERSYVYISGLSKSYEEAIELLEHVLANAKPDQKSYNDYISGILKNRSDSKMDRSAILWGGMLNYGIYGENSAFRDVLSEETLKQIDPVQLTGLISKIPAYKHKVFYFGPATIEAAAQQLSEFHSPVGDLIPIPAPIIYPQTDTKENKVYFVDYNMSQANVLMVSKASPFDVSLIPPSKLYDEYFGSGLSSIMFQEIRESRGLAYNAFSSFSVPGKPDRNNIVYGFVATQADKLMLATDAMLELMNEMPKSPKQFELAKESIIKKINTERIVKEKIFWTYIANLDMGIDYDFRKDVYERVIATDLDAFESEFFKPQISGLKYNFLVLGNKELMDMQTLRNIGKVEEMALDALFNY